VRVPPVNETTTTPNPQNDEAASATSLFAKLKKLNDKINIREAIRAIKDLNAMLSSAKTKKQKFNAMLEFSTKINDYDL
jgi:pantothenate kinase